MGLRGKESEVLVCLPIGKDVHRFLKDWIDVVLFKKEVEMLADSLLRQGFVPAVPNTRFHWSIHNRPVTGEEGASIISTPYSLDNELVVKIDGLLLRVPLFDSAC